MALTDPSGQPQAMQPGEFVSGTQVDPVRFATTGTPPPSMLYISRDDQLVFSGLNLRVADTLVISGRILLPDGSINFFQRSLPIPNPSSISSVVIQQTEGYLLSLAIQSTTAATRGFTFATVALQRGNNVVGSNVQVLVADYCTSTYPITFPAGRVLSPTEGPGRIITIPVANPGAGQGWRANVATAGRWRVQSIFMTLTTGAAVANRTVRVLYSANNLVNTVFSADANAVQAASTVNNIAAAPGAQPSAALTTDLTIALPFGCILYGGEAAAIVGTAVNIQAADQFSNVALLVEEWIDA